jgi:hypothetical protein
MLLVVLIILRFCKKAFQPYLGFQQPGVFSILPCIFKY